MFNSKIALRTLLFSLLATGLMIGGCKKDEETVQENITRVQVHLTGANGFDQEFEWSDPDGGDASNATVETIVIPASAGTNIHCHLHVYDDTKTPVEDLTEEIEAESDVHLFVFNVTGANIGVAYDDTDSNGKKVGIESLWTKGAASTGSINIKLYHEPTDKDNLSAPGGEVDFDVDFPVTVL
ncbi:MAG: hypothetical protein IT262_06585 [Saprospiraceae bacterium]|nr:hypothetical protein [Saprospiraceae bacterium]